MTKSTLLEIIVTSLEDARAAAAGGADRFELCSALALGGLTPSLGTLDAIKSELPIPVMYMIRPREGGMAYSESEFTVMLKDAELALEVGADGLVFGFLSSDGELDQKRCRKLVHLAESAAQHVEKVFHRAFDITARPDHALEQLVDLGVTRILTSGRAATALQGLEEIRRISERAAGRIQILPAGGIEVHSVTRVVEETGVDQIHLYLSRIRKDISVLNNPEIRLGGHVPGPEPEYHIVDEVQVRRARELLNG